MINIQMEGLGELHKLVERTQTLQRPIHVAMRAVGAFWTGYIQMRMTGESPSKPGEYPGVKTGMLRSSIMTTSVTWSEVAIASNVDYAGYLQFGTSKMLARPFIDREEATNELLQEFQSILQGQIDRYLGG